MVLSFTHTPVSKGLIYSVGITTFLCSAFGKKHLLNLPLVPHISRDHQYWRLLAHHAGFANTSDVFLATLMLVNISPDIERFFGNVKFGSFLVVCMLITTILEFCGLVGLTRLGVTTIPAGPFGITFSLLYQYYRLVPSTYHYRIFGITLSNKSFIYFLATQLIASQSAQALLPCLAGIIASSIYESPLLSLDSYRISPRACKLIQNVFGPLLARSPSPPRSTRTSSEDDADDSNRSALNLNTATTTTLNTRNGAEGVTRRSNATSSLREYLETFSGSQGASNAPPRPSATEIDNLRSMFPQLSREQVIQALETVDGDINRAAEHLLTATT